MEFKKKIVWWEGVGGILWRVESKWTSSLILEIRAEEANGLKLIYIEKIQNTFILFLNPTHIYKNTTSKQILICIYKYTLVNPFELFMYILYI